MSDKKNIDRLFQEKFKDFEVTPPEMVWRNIEAELKERKKRRVIPVWYRLSGVAALLIIGLLIGLPLFSDSEENPVVFENTIPVNSTQNNGNNSEAVTSVENSNSILKNGFDSGSMTVKDSGLVPSGTRPADTDHLLFKNGNAVTDAFTNKNNNKDKAKPFTIRKNAVVFDSKKSGNKLKNKFKKDSALIKINADNNNVNVTTSSSGSDSAKNNRIASGNVFRKNNDEFIKREGATKEANVIAQNPDNNGASEKQNQNRNNLKSSNVTETAIAETILDSTAMPQENELEKLLKEKSLTDEDKNTDLATAVKNKWSIKPQMAPVFYNSLANGSPIDKEFAGNSKDYNKDLSYGVGVDYALNDKISIRSGINTVNLGYSTNNVEFYADLNAETRNINPKARTAAIVVQNEGTAVSMAMTSFDGNSKTPTPTRSGSMEQTMGYIEVPMEMSYKLVDRKFGINIIGGVSTLFLNKNNVSVLSNEGYSSDIGKAENLNDIHFSTNVGIGFRYRFWKSFQANFEPTFKYQVNTFNTDTGNFKPYFIGLYSGVSFSF